MTFLQLGSQSNLNEPTEYPLTNPNPPPLLPKTQMVDFGTQPQPSITQSPTKTNSKANTLTTLIGLLPPQLGSTRPLTFTIQSSTPTRFLRRPYTKSQTAIYYLNSVFRVLSLVVVMYAGYVLPFLVVGMRVHLMWLEFTLSVLQLVAMVFRLATKKRVLEGKEVGEGCTFWENLKVASAWDWLQIVLTFVSIIPFELWSDGFLIYHLYYLKALRLVNLRAQFMHFYLRYISQNNAQFFTTLLTLHVSILWISAIWLDFSDLSDDPLRWRNVYCIDALSPTLLCYTKAIYFLMYTCLTIGYGEVAPLLFHQRALMIVFLIMGVMGIAYFVANFANFFQDKFLTDTEREKAVKQLSGIVRKIRGRLQRESKQEFQNVVKRAEDFLRIQFDLHLADQENFDMLHLLPESKRWLVASYLNRELGELEFFKKFNNLRVSALIPYMKQRKYNSYKRIVLQDMPSQLMFFVKSGSAIGLVSKRYALDIPLQFVEFLQSSCFGQYDLIPTCHPRRFSVFAGQMGCTVIGVPGYELRKFLVDKQQEREEVRLYCHRKLEVLRSLEVEAVKGYRRLRPTRDAVPHVTVQSQTDMTDYAELRPIEIGFEERSKEDRLLELKKTSQILEKAFLRMSKKRQQLLRTLAA